MAKLDNKTFSLPRTPIRSLSLMRITCGYVTVTTCLCWFFFFSFLFFFSPLGTRSDEIITTAFLFKKKHFRFFFPLKNIPFSVLWKCSLPTFYPHFDFPTIESDLPRNRTRLSFRISLIIWATELDTSLSSSICQPASICRYRARGLSLFRGDKVKMVIELDDLSSSVFQEKKNREKNGN